MPKHWLTEWNPENGAFWQHTGRRIASRNLWVSVANLLLAFAVWMMWSMVVVNLPDAGFAYTTNQLFWLAALPGLSGATLRLFFAFMVPLVGGRRWTMISTALLLLPALGVGFVVQDPQTPYAVMLGLAFLCGVGGGNFASSMANISFFFPRAQQGTALGVNAGLGNLGVSVAQFLIPLVITIPFLGPLSGEPQVLSVEGGERMLWLQNAAWVWVPLIVAAIVAAGLWMDDVGGTYATLREQSVVFRKRHTWLLCWLYVGTFGSFMGYAAGYPLLAHTQFPGAETTGLVFLGPLAGALFRPVGGWLADHFGGGRITAWVFITMTGAVIGVLGFLPQGPGTGSLWGFMAMFLLLFVATGIGNGSVFSMVPRVIYADSLRRAAGFNPAAVKAARHDAMRDTAAALGVVSAIGAYGAFFIPKSYGTSIALTGRPDTALYLAVLFYITCTALAWWYAVRERASSAGNE